MPQPIVRHIAHRAVQVAILAAGILAVMLVFSRQAHAAVTSAPPGVTSAVAPVTSAVTSAATPVTSAVTSAAALGHLGSATSAADAGRPPLPPRPPPRRLPPRRRQHRPGDPGDEPRSGSLRCHLGGRAGHLRCHLRPTSAPAPRRHPALPATSRHLRRHGQHRPSAPRRDPGSGSLSCHLGGRTGHLRCHLGSRASHLRRHLGHLRGCYPGCHPGCCRRRRLRSCHAVTSALVRLPGRPRLRRVAPVAAAGGPGRCPPSRRP